MTQLARTQPLRWSCCCTSFVEKWWFGLGSWFSEFVSIANIWADIITAQNIKCLRDKKNLRSKLKSGKVGVWRFSTILFPMLVDSVLSRSGLCRLNRSGFRAGDKGKRPANTQNNHDTYDWLNSLYIYPVRIVFVVVRQVRALPLCSSKVEEMNQAYQSYEHKKGGAGETHTTK